MRFSRKRLFMATGSAVISLAAGSVTAQDVSDVGTDEAAGRRQGLEEVVVTANYRETSLMDTAAAVSALSEDFMRNQGAEGLEDLFQLVPGLNMSSAAAGNNRFVVRGISSQTGESPLSITASAVGVYLDNVPVTSAVGPAVQMSTTIFDVQRIEVLKGPQGTLFGEGSQGGTIRYLFNKPDASAFDAGFTLGTSGLEESDDTGHRFDGMVNLPITDTMAVRLMAFDTKRPGFVDNLDPFEKDFNDSSSRGGRLSFAWNVSDRVDIEASYYTSEQEFNGINRSVRGRPYVNDSGRTPGKPPGSTDEFDLYNLVANVDLGFATLTASTAYSERNMLFFHEYSRELAGFIDLAFSFSQADIGWPTDLNTIDSIINRNRVISEHTVHELRLVSKDDGPLRWTAGLFYKNADDLYDFLLDATVKPGREEWQDDLVDILAPDPDSINGLDNLEHWAVYGEVSYDFNEQWTLTVGGRYSDLQQQIATEPDAGAEDSPFTPKVVLSWQPNDDVLIYGSYATGFRQGNVNRLFGQAAEEDLLEDINADPPPTGDRLASLQAQLQVTRENLTFDSDLLHNYELGLKASLWDGQAELKTSFYYVLWEDLIQEFKDPVLIEQFPNDTYNENLGDAEVMGAELELSVALPGGLFWTLGGDINESEVQEGALKGKELLFAPNYSVTTGLDYTFALTGGIDMTLHGDVSYVGDQFANGSNDESRRIPSYHMANARIVLNSTTDTAWRAALYVRNVTNEANLVNIADLQSDYFYSNPRTYGLELGWQY